VEGLDGQVLGRKVVGGRFADGGDADGGVDPAVGLVGFVEEGELRVVVADVELVEG